MGIIVEAGEGMVFFAASVALVIVIGAFAIKYVRRGK